MKMVVIMSVDAYASTLEKMYAEHQVPVFSELNIEGFRLDEPDVSRENWFGRTHTALYTKLTFAFVSDDKSTELLAAVDEYNRDQSGISPIRAFQMQVEKSV